MTKRVISSILWVQGNIPRNYNRQTTENKTSEAAGLQVLPSLISRSKFGVPLLQKIQVLSHLANIHKKAASRQSQTVDKSLTLEIRYRAFSMRKNVVKY